MIIKMHCNRIKFPLTNRARAMLHGCSIRFKSLRVKEMISDKLMQVTCTAIRYICLCNKYVLIGVRCVTVLANVNFISFDQEAASVRKRSRLRTIVNINSLLDDEFALPFVFEVKGRFIDLFRFIYRKTRMFSFLFNSNSTFKMYRP